MRAPTSDRRLLFRFAVGAIELGRENLLGQLRSADEPHPRARPAGRGYQLVGAMVSAPAWLGSAARAARRGIALLVSPPLRLVRRTGVGSRVEHRVRDLRARMDRTLASWDELGRAELVAGRGLAEAGLDHIYAEVFARLAGPELAELVHDQSAGLTRGVVDDLRERSARADARAEELVRWLRRKRP